jgi:hypothetical protein
MGKLVQRPMHQASGPKSLSRLRNRRRKLFAQLAALDKQISKLAPSKPSPSPDELDRWLEELSAGLDHLPRLPADFSRADLYDDHD